MIWNGATWYCKCGFVNAIVRSVCRNLACSLPRREGQVHGAAAADTAEDLDLRSSSERCFGLGGGYGHDAGTNKQCPDCADYELAEKRGKSDWIQTFTGGQFWPLAPKPEDVVIEDIAHALSNICRYTGHVKEFYSVADHSIRVSEIVPMEDALWALLHDAAEAYICDVARPVKRHPGFGELYGQIEDRLMLCICERFNLPAKQPPSVKVADNILLHTERRDLMERAPQAWRDACEPMKATIIPRTPRQAEVEFLMRFYALSGQGAR